MNQKEIKKIRSYNKSLGMFVGVGVGPGDPELLTLKAYRKIKNADMVFYLKTHRGNTQAKDIAKAALNDAKPDQQLKPIVLPDMSQRVALEPIYDEASAQIKAGVVAGLTVVFLCEGDPLFFGSFNYLLARLANQVPIEIIAGISSMHAASAALQTPLAMMRENCLVLSGYESCAELVNYLKQYDTLVILKAGSARKTILKALSKSGRMPDAKYAAYVGRDNECLVTDCSHLSFEAGPYFSLFVVTRSGESRFVSHAD